MQILADCLHPLQNDFHEPQKNGCENLQLKTKTRWTLIAHQMAVFLGSYKRITNLDRTHEQHEIVFINF